MWHAILGMDSEARGRERERRGRLQQKHEMVNPSSYVAQVLGRTLKTKSQTVLKKKADENLDFLLVVDNGESVCVEDSLCKSSATSAPH